MHMRQRRVKIRHKGEDDAVAGIIVAVMIVGLVIAVVSIIQTVYVPQWMSEREATHMMEVADQFSQIKYTLDNLAVSEKTTPVSTYITLGNKELGFLSSARAFGHLQLITQGCSVEISHDEGTSVTDFYTLEYSSENAYYLDQTYIYESGAVILEQAEGTVMINTPSVSIEKDGVEGTISMGLIALIPEGGVTTLGGYGTYPLRLRYKDTPISIDLNGTESIKIETPYTNSWYTYFSNALKTSEFLPGVDYAITKDDSFVTLTFSDTIDVTVTLEIFEIYIQMAPGWV